MSVGKMHQRLIRLKLREIQYYSSYALEVKKEH